MYSNPLIAGWLQMLNQKDSNHVYELLLFSDPVSWYTFRPKPYWSKHLSFHDYYILHSNEVEENFTEKLDLILEKFNTNSRVIIDCLSSIILYSNLAIALKFIEKLSRKVEQLICIYRRDFSPVKIRKIETLGTTYVKLEPVSTTHSIDLNYMVKIRHYKLGGSVISQSETVSQNTIDYEIESIKINNTQIKYPSAKEEPKIESSFRMEINDDEMKQKSKIQLPYTNVVNEMNTSKIIYQAEEADDMDEDDPDYDLCL